MNEKKIGFVGVGRMGANMARHLQSCGMEITAIYDTNSEAAKSVAAELKSIACKKLSEVTKLADVIITVVSDDAAMERIFSMAQNADSLLTPEAKGKLFINCATVTPSVHVELEKSAEKFGAQTLEACMASSISQALDGTLYLMCAGQPEAFSRAEPILKHLGKTVHYVGTCGRAAELKALVNMVMNINTAGLAEGLGLAAALKLDLNTVRKVFSETGAASRVLETDGEDMQNRNYDCYFSGAHAAKDSGIALTLAKEVALELPLAAATKAQYDRMVELGLGELDKSGIAELTFRN